MKRLAIVPVGLGLIACVWVALEPSGAHTPPTPVASAQVVRAQPHSPEPRAEVADRALHDEGAPTSAAAFDLAESARQVVLQYNLSSEDWARLDGLDSAALDREVEKTQAAFDDERERTLQLSAQHEQLAQANDAEGANALLATQILPLLEQRQQLVGRMLLIAHARRRLIDAELDEHEARAL